MILDDKFYFYFRNAKNISLANNSKNQSDYFVS